MTEKKSSKKSVIWNFFTLIFAIILTAFITDYHASKNGKNDRRMRIRDGISVNIQSRNFDIFSYYQTKRDRKSETIRARFQDNVVESIKHWNTHLPIYKSDLRFYFSHEIEAYFMDSIYTPSLSFGATVFNMDSFPKDSLESVFIELRNRNNRFTDTLTSMITSQQQIENYFTK